MSQSRAKLVKRKIKNVKSRRDVKRKRAQKFAMNRKDEDWDFFQEFLENRKKRRVGCKL